jgi:hypothetical protein
MLLPFGIFWVLLILTRRELGLRGILFCAPLGAGLMAVFWLLPAFFIYAVIGQVLLDVILILVLFGGDIRIN